MTDKTQTAQRSPRTSGLDGYFRISERGSTVSQEVRGGVVTFLTMAYIIVLNPLILGFVPDSTGAFLGGGTEPGSGIPAIAAGTAAPLASPGSACHPQITPGLPTASLLGATPGAARSFCGA